MIENKILLFQQNMVEEKLNFFVFKGLENLDFRIKNGGSDIDIYIDKNHIKKAREIILNLGFKKNIHTVNQFVIFERESNRFLMLDLVTYIPLGNKPYYEFRMIPKFNELSLDSKKLNRLKNSDYLVLSTVRNILNTKSFDKELFFLKEIVKNEEIENNYFSTFFSINIKELVNEIIKVKDWNELRNKYYKYFKKKVKKNLSYHTLPRLIVILVEKTSYYTKKILFRRNGFFIVIQGVDGAGKSSLVKYLENQEYLKHLGIKSIYFGHNNYWIPFLKKMIKRKNKSIFFSRLLFILSYFDRRMRVLKVILFKFFGYVVVGDRYYYDDLIVSRNTSYMFSVFKKLFLYEKIYTPDLLIYLKVSPKVSFKRKQDYSFNLLKKTIKNYDLYFSKFMTKKFFFEIDANKSHTQIKRQALKKVYEIILK